MKRIGILGGTFNPVHREHILLARAAKSQLNLDKLIVMPTYISPHKDSKPAPSIDRLNMLKLAFSDDDGIEVSDYEINKKGKSYTFETVEHFKNQEDAEIFFICGSDMLTDFKTWRNPQRILDACTLAVFGREDFFTDYSYESEYFTKTFNKKYVKLNHIGKKLSSTKLRVYSMFSLSLDGLTDQKVENYIKENNLYQGDKYIEFVKTVLPQKRLIHTANVLVTALKKVKELNLDEQKVIISCTLHDCAKYLDYKDFEGFLIDDDMPSPVIHAFLGAFIAENRLGIKDKEIVDAVRYHTSGRANMTMLEKLVFVADMICEERDYEGVDYLRSLYEKSDFEHCFRECLREEYIHLQNKKGNIYFETLNAFNYYINQKKEG